MAHMIPPAESGGKSVPTAIAQVVAQLLDEGSEQSACKVGGRTLRRRPDRLERGASLVHVVDA
jgi:hypothetical protein